MFTVMLAGHVSHISCRPTLHCNDAVFDTFAERKFDFLLPFSALSVPRNYDPSLHPFELCREYTRALNATKIERVLAKPFLAALDGHRDGVNCLAKHTTSLSTLLSGSCDGEVTVSVITAFVGFAFEFDTVLSRQCILIYGQNVFVFLLNHR